MSGGIFILVLYGIVFLLASRSKSANVHPQNQQRTLPVTPDEIVLHGNDTGIGFDEVVQLLNRHHSYYKALSYYLQEQFAHRVWNFMHSKTFIIKAEEGYKEMPVLISAAAVQLTFGLKRFLLPHFSFIRIHPGDYVHQENKIYEGHVEGHVITIGWDPFLSGYKQPGDGVNLGLHEMSHALYLQVMREDVLTEFRFVQQYKRLMRICKPVCEANAPLYSQYACSHLQEFWAESVELFFEKPEVLKSHHPLIYSAMKDLLRQDPLDRANPVFG